jgi:membrane-associated phospholipid phosphatase
VPIAWLLIFFLFATSSLQATQLPSEPNPQPQRSFNFEPRRDWTLLAAGGAMWGLSALAQPDHRCPCSPAGINGIDRGFAGDPFRNGPAKASDILNGITWSAPFLIDYLDLRRKPSGTDEFKQDALILGQAFLLNQGLNSLTKNLVNRPRPFVYGLPPGHAEYTEDDSYRSFYSGHASSAFALSMAYARIHTRRHPESSPALVYGIAIGVSTTTAILRVRAGKHFPTDVIVGSATGIAIGLAIPALHD